nr:hypothetical protein [Tanacetum cinerariifolium]
MMKEINFAVKYVWKDIYNYGPKSRRGMEEYCLVFPLHPKTCFCLVDANQRKAANARETPIAVILGCPRHE